MNKAYFDTVYPHRLAPDSVADQARVECPIRFWARNNPESIALRIQSPTNSEQGSRISETELEFVGYKELDKLISDTQAFLHSKIRQQGLLAGIVVDDSVATIIVIFACLRAQIPLVLFSGRDPESVVEQAVIEQGLAAIVRVGLASDLNFEIEYTGIDNPTILSGDCDVKETMGMTRDAAELSLDIPATMVYTSGSMAEPSLAVHSVRNHLASASAACDVIPLPQESSWLMSLDLNHVGGLGILFRCFMTGASVTVAEGGWSAVAPNIPGVTHISLVPTQLLQILEARRLERIPYPSNPINLLVGGGAVSEHHIREAVGYGFVARTTYGLTEFASQVATSNPWSDDSSESFPLIMLRHVDARIRNGILSVKGESLFLGYLRTGQIHSNRPEEGYFQTGDLAEITAGELTIMGRSDLMFVSGGENIQPSEIESCLLSIPGIEQAAVVSIPSDSYGMRPVAFLKRSTDSKDTSEIESLLRQVLPGFKIPDHFFDWPADVNGRGMKFSRQKLTDLAKRLQPVAEKGRRALR